MLSQQATLGFSASDGVHTATLSGFGAQSLLVVNPGSLDFGAVQQYDSSVVQQLTLTNTGNVASQISSLGFLSGQADFGQANNCAQLSPGGSCTINVQFTPSQTAAAEAVLAVVPVEGSPVTISVEGRGQAANISVIAPTFESVPVGSRTEAVATVRNAGIGAVSISTPAAASVTGPGFEFVSTTCGSSLEAEASCDVTIASTQLDAQPHAGLLTVTTAFGERVASLSSTATQGFVSLSSATLAFANTQVGTTAASQVVTVTNSGTAPLHVSGVSVSSGGESFSQSNNCGVVPMNGTCLVDVTFAPSSTGSLSGSILLSHDGMGASTIGLSGTGVSATAALSTPSFAATPVGSSSIATATLTNTGIGALSVAVPTSASVTGIDFSFVSTTCTASLAVSGTCTVTVKFSPSSTTERGGTLSIDTGAGTKSVSLGSTGIQGYASMSPSSLSFAAQQTSTSSTAQVITVTNTGTDTLTLSGVGISAGGTDFAQSNNCAVVAVNGTCTVNVSFTPSATGTRAGMVSFVHNGGGIANVTLTGTGQAASGTLSSLSFSTTAVGASSLAVATLTNTGVGALTVTPPTAASVTGTDFSFVATNCEAGTLAAGASCSVTVKFQPTGTTARTGSLSVVSGAGELTATLSATGIQGHASVSASSLSFATQQTGTTSAVQSVTVTNNGTATLNISGVSVTSGASDFAQSNGCGAPLAINGTCVVSVAFTPSAPGTRTGTVTFAHDGDGATSFTLTGTGQAPSATLGAIDFGVTQVGQSYSRTSTLTNTGLSGISVTTPTAASVTGTYYSFSSTTCGTSLAAGATCTVTVTYAPGAAATHTGTLSFATGAGTQFAGLTASAQVATATLSNPTFANDYSGDASGDLKVSTLANTGVGPLSLTTPSAASVTGTDFSFVSTTCGTSLALGASCDTTLKFQATAGGARSGSFSITTGAGAKSVTLAGTGIAPTATLSTPSFASTPVGSSSNATATLTNAGIGVLSVTVPTAASVTGTDFSFVSTTCTASVAVSGTCTVTVKFSPTSTAARTGTLSIDTGAGTKSVSLGSAGIQGFASMSPSSLTFAAQQTSTSSTAQVITVTNTGTDTLTFSGMGISTGATDFAQSNNCAAVAVNGTCTVNVSFTPSTTGSRTGTVAFTHNGGGIAIINLTGTGQGPSASISNWNAGGVAVGSNTSGSVTVTNTGVGSITVAAPTAASVTGTGFSWQSTGTQCNGALAAGGTCVVYTVFTPSAAGAASGSVSVNAGVAGTLTAALSGTGLQGNASLSAASLTYGAQQTGTTSGTQSVTITNNGTSPLTISGVSVSAGATDFAQTNTCSAALAVSGTCSISVSFSPTAAGTRTGTVSFTRNGTGASSFSMTGTGQAPSATLSNVAFGTVQVGSNSTLTSTLTNTGLGALTVTQPTAASVTGTDFSFVSTTCVSSLAVGANCSVSVKFSPTASTTRSGTLSFATGAGTMSASLGGTGVQGTASYSASSLTYASQTVGTTSASQSVTVTNTGSAPLTISGVAVTAGSSNFGVSNTCGSSVPVNGTCTVVVSFTPSAAGTLTGTVTITSNASNGNGTISLSGTGAAASPLVAVISQNDLNNVPVGTTSSGQAWVRFENQGSTNVQYTGLTIATPLVLFDAFCDPGDVIAPGDSCTVFLKVTPTSAGSFTRTVTMQTNKGPATIAVPFSAQ